MELTLQYPPTPEAAPRHANLAVEAAADISHVTLDYSVDSLAMVDSILDEWHRESVRTEDVASALFAFGCYVGEVFVRNVGARWISAAGTSMEPFAGFFIVLELGRANFINPIGKVFKRVENGEEDNLPYFYSVFAHPPRTPARPEQSSKPFWFKRLFRGR
jgi:hypothetical protein